MQGSVSSWGASVRFSNSESASEIQQREGDIVATKLYGLTITQGTDATEFKHWKDVGCTEVSPSCLTCPLPKCKHDDPYAHKRIQVRLKYQMWMNTMETEGVSVDAMAKKVNVTPRSIFRAISTIKRERLQDA